MTTATAEVLPFDIDKSDYLLHRQEAAFCYFYYEWRGHDIFSTCYAIDECKVTGKINLRTFGVEVNPLEPTAFDEWEQACWDYIPCSYMCSFRELAEMPNTSWSDLTRKELQQRFDKEKEELIRLRQHYQKPPILYKHWAFGSPSELKKRNKKVWQETYQIRKAYKNISEFEYFQLRLRGLRPAA
jgi:hypothetical protein